MMRRLVLALMSFALLVACEQDAPNGPPKVTPPSDDVGQSPLPTRRLDAGRKGDGPTRVVAELAGTWHGEATTKEEGRAVGVLRVSDHGDVNYEVTSSGKRTTGRLRIDSWDGTELQVRDGARTYKVRGVLSGDAFQTRLPLVGEVTLNRR